MEKIQSGVAATRETQGQNINNITRLAASIENFSLRLSKQLTEGGTIIYFETQTFLTLRPVSGSSPKFAYFAEKIQDLIAKHESALQSDESDFSSDLESQTRLGVETELQTLGESVSQLTSLVHHQMEECSAKIAEEVKTVNEANSEFQSDLQGVQKELEDLTDSISRLSKAKEVSETLTDLKNRVKDQNNKLNQFIQNVISLKKLPQMVEDLKKRLELIKN